ncbi:MAG: hypothetical protein WCR71_03505, partial [Bacteroidales bacterium]
MKKIIVTSLSLLLLTTLLLTSFTWFVLFRPNSSNTGAVLFIKENTSLEKLIKILEESCAIKKTISFKIASNIWKLDGNIKPGRYRIEPGTNNRQLVRLFLLGLQEPHNLVLAGNIRTLEKL